VTPAGPRAGATSTPNAADEDVHGEIDEAALATWMDHQGLPGSGERLTTRFVTGGASNELFEITRGAHTMALRRPPTVVPKGRNETMLREYRLLAALAGTDVPHARAIAGCDDPSVLGGCFYLMEFVDGWSPIQEGTTWPTPFDTDVEARRGLAFELVRGIARLASVDWQAVGLEGFGRPDGFHERQVDRWLSHLQAFQFRPLPGIDEAAAWLRAHKPSTYRPGIMHGDYQFANVMYRHGAPARLAAIVDWEMATVGDPLLDVGWVVNGWPDDAALAAPIDPGADAPPGTISYVDYRGMPTKDALLEAYATESGRPVDEIDYYVILARFKLAIVLEGGYARVMAGEADNPKMALFGDVVLDMAAKAAELAATTDLR
jgi:aminoglycoside phosphotransferase (APT) family kinase protein